MWWMAVTRQQFTPELMSVKMPPRTSLGWGSGLMGIMLRVLGGGLGIPRQSFDFMRQ